MEGDSIKSSKYNAEAVDIREQARQSKKYALLTILYITRPSGTTNNVTSKKKGRTYILSIHFIACDRYLEPPTCDNSCFITTVL